MKPNTIYQGNCTNIMQPWDAGCIDMCVCSPPYWALRKYDAPDVVFGNKDCEHKWGDTNIEHDNLRYRGENAIVGSNKNPEIHKGKEDSAGNFCLKCGAWKGQLGLEPTFDLYIKHLCDIFDEVKRVLKPEGTLWVNIGDTYGGSNCGYGQTAESSGFQNVSRQEYYPTSKSKPLTSNILPKSLILIPFRFAIEMVNRGWILRNTLIWHKQNCMPSSAKDRFTVDFEYLFFFSKSNKALYWTNEKTLEMVTKQPLGTKGTEGTDWEWRMVSNKRKKVSLWTGHDYYFEQQFEEHLTINEFQKRDMLKRKLNDSDRQYAKHSHGPQDYNPQGRNKRCVWTIPTMPCSEAHFAVYPEKLIETPIKAGCPEFICKKCGKAREKIWDKETARNSWGNATDNSWSGYPKNGRCGDIKHQLKGYTDCGCNAGWTPGIVLDPFAGRGTTGIVAQKLGRSYVLIELSEEYVKLCKKNLSQKWLF